MRKTSTVEVEYVASLHALKKKIQFIKRDFGNSNFIAYMPIYIHKLKVRKVRLAFQ